MDLKGKVIGGWLIGDPIGSGKSATVYLATTGQQTAAVKVFNPSIIEKYGREVQVARIAREVSLIEASHPNLIRVLGGGECPDTGYLYVAMEYLPHQSLDRALKDIPRAKIKTIVAQVASAARYLLDERNIVHRDIKPSNILVSPDSCHATLLDLGVIKPLVDPDLTDKEASIFVGTLRYSPPEFLTREEENNPDAWRAVTFYQLGGVLHDLIMHMPLFAEFSNPYGRLVKAILDRKPVLKADDVEPALIRLSACCLVKDPAERLALITWDDFEAAGGEATIDTQLGTIERRQLFERGRERRKPTAHAQTLELLADVRDLLSGHLLQALAQLNKFPPRSIFSLVDKKVPYDGVLLVFPPSPSRGVTASLGFAFQVHCRSLSDRTCIVRAAAFWQAKQGSAVDVKKLEFTDLLVGVADSLIDPDVLKGFLVSKLTALYQKQDLDAPAPKDPEPL